MLQIRDGGFRNAGSIGLRNGDLDTVRNECVGKVIASDCSPHEENTRSWGKGFEECGRK